MAKASLRDEQLNNSIILKFGTKKTRLIPDEHESHKLHESMPGMRHAVTAFARFVRFVFARRIR